MRNIQTIFIPLLPLCLGLVACGGSGQASPERDGTAAAAGAAGAAAEGEPDTRLYQVDVPAIAGSGGSASAAGSTGTAGVSAAGTSTGGTSDAEASASQPGEPSKASPDAPDAPAPHEVSQTLKPVAQLSGVLADPARPGSLCAFFSFDLRELPADIVKLDHALVRSADYTVSTPVPVYDVSFNELSAASDAPTGALITTLPAGLSGNQPVPPALWPNLAAEYAARGARPYAQFRLDLPEGASLAAVSELVGKTSIELDYFVR